MRMAVTKQGDTPKKIFNKRAFKIRANICLI